MSVSTGDMITDVINYHGQQLRSLLESSSNSQMVRSLNQRHFDYNRYQSRGRELTIQPRSQRLRLLQFIAQKSDRLFVPVALDPTDLVPRFRTEDYFGCHLPNLGEALSVSSGDYRHQVISILRKGDVVLCEILGVRPSGIVRVAITMVLTANCILLPKTHYLHAQLGNFGSFDHTQRPFQLRSLMLAVVFSVDQKLSTFLSLSESDLPRDLVGVFSLGPVEFDALPERCKNAYKYVKSSRSYETGLFESVIFRNPSIVYKLTNNLGLSMLKYTFLSSFSVESTTKSITVTLRKRQSSHWAKRLVAKGVDFFQQGELSEAFQCLNQALNVDATNIDALVARGALFANRGNYEKAIDDFKVAIGEDFQHQKAQQYMSDTLLAQMKVFEERKYMAGLLDVLNLCRKFCPNNCVLLSTIHRTICFLKGETYTPFNVTGVESDVVSCSNVSLSNCGNSLAEQQGTSLCLNNVIFSHPPPQLPSSLNASMVSNTLINNSIIEQPCTLQTYPLGSTPVSGLSKPSFTYLPAVESVHTQSSQSCVNERPSNVDSSLTTTKSSEDLEYESRVDRFLKRLSCQVSKKPHADSKTNSDTLYHKRDRLSEVSRNKSPYTDRQRLENFPSSSRIKSQFSDHGVDYFSSRTKVVGSHGYTENEERLRNSFIGPSHHKERRDDIITVLPKSVENISGRERFKKFSKYDHHSGRVDASISETVSGEHKFVHSSRSRSPCDYFRKENRGSDPKGHHKKQNEKNLSSSFSGALTSHTSRDSEDSVYRSSREVNAHSIERFPLLNCSSGNSVERGSSSMERYNILNSNEDVHRSARYEPSFQVVGDDFRRSLPFSSRGQSEQNRFKRPPSFIELQLPSTGKSRDRRGLVTASGETRLIRKERRNDDIQEVLMTDDFLYGDLGVSSSVNVSHRNKDNSFGHGVKSDPYLRELKELRDEIDRLREKRAKKRKRRTRHSSSSPINECDSKCSGLQSVDSKQCDSKDMKVRKNSRIVKNIEDVFEEYKMVDQSEIQSRTATRKPEMKIKIRGSTEECYHIVQSADCDSGFTPETSKNSPEQVANVRCRSAADTRVSRSLSPVSIAERSPTRSAYRRRYSRSPFRRTNHRSGDRSRSPSTYTHNSSRRSDNRAFATERRLSSEWRHTDSDSGPSWRSNRSEHRPNYSSRSDQSRFHWRRSPQTDHRSARDRPHLTHDSHTRR